MIRVRCFYDLEVPSPYYISVANLELPCLARGAALEKAGIVGILYSDVCTGNTGKAAAAAAVMVAVRNRVSVL